MNLQDSNVLCFHTNNFFNPDRASRLKRIILRLMLRLGMTRTRFSCSIGNMVCCYLPMHSGKTALAWSFQNLRAKMHFMRFEKRSN